MPSMALFWKTTPSGGDKWLWLLRRKDRSALESWLRFRPTQPMPEIVFDPCVLGNFAPSASLSLLKPLNPPPAFITDAVAWENLRGI